MNKRTLLLLALLLPAYIVSAQDSTKAAYRIYIKPTQFVMLDFPVMVERVQGKMAYGVMGSFKPATRNSAEVKGLAKGLFGGYELQNMGNPLYNAITGGLYAKRFHHKTSYVCLELFYRHWWFDNKQGSYDNIEGYRFNGLRTERQNVVGLKVLFGETIVNTRFLGKRFLLDIYGGFGARYKSYRFETTNGTVWDLPNSDGVDKGVSRSLSLHFGLNIGIGGS